jgi:hypothetical protein
MALIRSCALGLLMTAAAVTPAVAQYLPPNPGGCASSFTYSAGVCVPRGGGGNAYKPPRPGSCASGFTYSAGMCVPRGGGATNAYLPPRPGSCATGYTYSASMCVPRR